MKEKLLTEYDFKKDTVLFGTGSLSKKLSNHFDSILFYVDNNLDKRDSLFNGKYVFSPQKMVDEILNTKITIVIASSYYDDIYKQLVDLGFEKTRIINGLIIQKILDWGKNGKLVPPPHEVKQNKIIQFVKKYNIEHFIETGTYKGDMLEALKREFKKLYSIELDKHLFKKALIKFHNEKHIKLLNGDSGEILPKLLKEVPKQCIFWLDGHYSGEGTAKGYIETPIIKELESIFKHNRKDHVILIDDARLFNGKNDYPTINQLKEFIKMYNEGLFINVEDDIIIITKFEK